MRTPRYIHRIAAIDDDLSGSDASPDSDRFDVLLSAPLSFVRRLKRWRTVGMTQQSEEIPEQFRVPTRAPRVVLDRDVRRGKARERQTDRAVALEPKLNLNRDTTPVITHFHLPPLLRPRPINR